MHGKTIEKSVIRNFCIQLVSVRMKYIGYVIETKLRPQRTTEILSPIIRVELWRCFVSLHHTATKCYLLTQLATGTHRFGIATLNYT